MNEQIKINWCRSKVDKAVMSDLMRKSDARAFAHVIPQLLLYAATGTLAYLAYLHVHANTWHSALPLLFSSISVSPTSSVAWRGTNSLTRLLSPPSIGTISS